MVNPLADFDEPGAADRVARAEEAKHVKYDDLCRTAKVRFNAFGVSTLGGVGPEAVKFLGSILDKLCKTHGKTEGQTLAQEAAQRISVACQRAVAAQLLRSLACVVAPLPPRCGPSVALSEAECEAERRELMDQ